MTSKGGAVWRHRLTDIDPEKQTATCAVCGPEMQIGWNKYPKLEQGGRWRCRGKYWERNWERSGARWTVSLYLKTIKDQKGLCKICGQKPTNQHGVLLADHCHDTLEPRAALCYLCNIGLGAFADDPTRLRAAADYIEEYRDGNRTAPTDLQANLPLVLGTVRDRSQGAEVL